MSQFNQFWLRFLQEEDGPTAVEYAVMLALIIVVCIIAITTIGTQTDKIYRDEILAKGLGKKD